MLRPCAFLVSLLVAPASLLATPVAVTVSSDDTSIAVAIVNDRPVVVSLLSVSSAAQWCGPRAKSIPLIESAEVERKTIPLKWRFAEARDGTLRFLCDEPPLESRSIWRAHRGPGPVEHEIVITNRGPKPVIIPVQKSLEMDLSPGRNRLEQWWVDKGASTPTPEGTHHRELKAGDESVLRCWPSGRDRPRDPIPWTSVQDLDAHCGWYAGVEFTARTEIAFKDTGSLHLTMGLQTDAQTQFVTRIMPGESFQTPTVFIGCYEGDVDDGANRMRRWVRTNLTPPVHNPKYPLLVNNSWGSGMAVDEKLSRKMIDESAELGLEMFHIDAGWFRTVGDWRPDPRKFPKGLRVVSDYAHSKGLKFGLWVGWTQGGDQVDPTGEGRILSPRDPKMAGWFPADLPANWKAKDFSGATVCLGNEAATDWCLNVLRGIMKEDNLDLLEHDQVMVIDGCRRDTHQHTHSPIDVGYRAAQGYYKVYDTLRSENPDLLFENCVNGGHMIDYGAVRRCHYISITDTYDPLSNRRAFYDASYALPPAMCECYISQVSVRSISQFLYMLRSGMMGWCTIMTDTSKWSLQQHAAAKKQFALYKQRLRPLIQSANLYHISERPDGIRWDGIEYMDPTSGKGAAFMFRGATGQTKHTFLLKGLAAYSRYQLSFEDGSNASVVKTGAELMTSGLEMHLSEPESSEIVHIARQ